MFTNKFLLILAILLPLFITVADSAPTRSKSSRAASKSKSSRASGLSKSTNEKKPFVAVIAGGPQGDEGNMSEKLGKRITGALKERGYRTAIYNPNSPFLFLIQLQYRKIMEGGNLVAFNACQGEFGGSGIVQAVFEWLRIPHTHSGLSATMLATNKVNTKAIVEKAGVRVSPSVVFNTKTGDREALCNNPVVTGGSTVLKPLNEANSSGVEFFKKGECPSAEFLANWKYGDEFMMERYIPGHEYSITVLNHQILGLVQFEWARDPKKNLLKNENEYDQFPKWEKDAKGGATWGMKTHIEDKELEQELHRLSLLADKALGCHGISRSDFRVKEECDAEGKCRNVPYFLETNTQPGMSEISPPGLVAKKYRGWEYADLVDYMVKHPRTFN